MSKTFMYLIVTIVTYLLIVKGLGVIEATDEEKEQSNKTDSKGTLENDVSKGAAGQQRYRFGAPYSNDVQEQSTNKAADDLSNKIKNDLSYTM